MTNTGSDGLAKCGIQRDKDLDAKNSSLQVEATLLDVLLLDDEGKPIKEAGNPVHPSIRFNANTSMAAKVAYEPSVECSELQECTTVEGALNKLCQMPRGGGCFVTVGKGG